VRIDVYLLSHSDTLQITAIRNSIATCTCDGLFHWCPRSLYRPWNTLHFIMRNEITADKIKSS